MKRKNLLRVIPPWVKTDIMFGSGLPTLPLSQEAINKNKI